MVFHTRVFTNSQNLGCAGLANLQVRGRVFLARRGALGALFKSLLKPHLLYAVGLAFGQY